MAQTNYTPISLYYSTTASAVPTAANLVQGELAINTNDGKLYYEDSSGVVRVLASKSTGSIGGSTNQVQYNSSGSLAGSANFVFDGTNLGLGVTPSAWGSGSKGFQVLKGGLWHDNSQYFSLVNNAYYDGTNWKYISTAASSQIAQINGESRFYNAASGTAGDNVTYTQAMTLDVSGNLLVGTTNTTKTNTGFRVESGVANTSRGSTGSFFEFYDTVSGSRIGFISNSGGVATLYNTTSDQRLKTNIVDAPSGNIDSIKVRSFDWVGNGSHQPYGMVAQELIEVAPYAVNKPENPDEMMAVDYSKLVPMMIKEIQDLKQRIASLENK